MTPVRVRHKLASGTEAESEHDLSELLVGMDHLDPCLALRNARQRQPLPVLAAEYPGRILMRCFHRWLPSLARRTDLPRAATIRRAGAATDGIAPRQRSPAACAVRFRAVQTAMAVEVRLTETTGEEAPMSGHR